MEDPIAVWLRDVVDDEVVIDPDAINVEAIRNLRCFSLEAEQTTRDSPGEVAAFLRAVVAARNDWLNARKIGTEQMRLYCWFDEQAGQLRLSMVSATHGRLPFA